MQKDVIYIDTEDDITAIIGKVKASGSHIVALVPPKRIGAIQSAVNLKLVHRATEQADKRLVIITNNPALTALAASTGIPVAKNLQSRPELPEVAALEIEGDDVIDGSELPESKHVERAKPIPVHRGEDAVASEEGADEADVAEVEPAAPERKLRGGVIPNFDAFRKKLFFGLVGIVLLAGFLVWAMVYAPRASIVIKAKTSESALNSKVTAGATLATSLKDGTLKAEVKTSTKDVSLPVTATGKKDVGEKATGTVRIKTDAATILISGLTVPAGTAIGYNGLTYYTTEQAVFPKSDPGGLSGVVVGVKAAESGTKYNGATGAASSPAAGVTSVTFVSASTGGTDKTVTVVQQSDVDAVSNEVIKTDDTEAAKKALKDQFSGDYILIEDSFKVDSAGVKPAPAIGQEATDGKAALAGKISYSVTVVAKAEAAKFLDAYFAQQVDGRPNQKVYDNGAGTVSLGNSVINGDKTVATISANGKIGPKVSEAEIKEYAKGKKSGEIKVYAESISGVESATVNFSPFWVTKAPGDVNKITVQFTLNG